MPRYVNRSPRQLFRKAKTLSKKSDGFTLVELLVTVVVASILSGAIITAFLSGTLGFRLTNDTSELRSEADYLVSSILSEVNRSEFDAVTMIDDTYQFHRLSEPKISSAGMIYRQAGYESIELNLSDSSYTPSNPNVILEQISIQLLDPVYDARRPRYMTSGLFEIELVLSLAENPDSTRTFKSAIPF
ncbi:MULTISPECIES: prepilin-type N-terminal cleavage/methylation domain-containing protein [Exiguobacterium]|uniref:Prepilin-type N-terminal cleavage/methylation domain-containing protein n=1 Tax=Exiguobacterium aurantiacum TaxID=33987 RepID=A0ABY5FKG3_9BACL|nr:MULTISPECIES: prepilin-type N-terminal cleavage/methylation domain-containing protein [Exiguobacterium]UTT42058.1 prepilin-type N-terminal cleavage/methylation domain-containing protein [Exiguobacterium aurantiacum]